ncbi:MAG: HAD-IIA family hydrolase [Ornithinimicrobium sp.]
MSFAAIIFDLDGVVYVDGDACDGALEGIDAARSDGLSVLFMTNNASRTPDQVVKHLGTMGVDASPQEVLTSSQIGARRLVDHRDADRREEQSKAPLVLAVGGPGVSDALREQGFDVLAAGDVPEGGPPRPFWAVLQGYGPQMHVTDLHEAGYAINAGARWVVTNDDATLPTSRGFAPGNGALVAAVKHGTGAVPEVVGKPHRRAYETALARLELPAERVLAVGDRLDTDIQGANAARVKSALVLTGVNNRDDASAASGDLVPDIIVDRIPDLAQHWR